MKKLLISAPAFAVVACRYAPGERHPPHTDGHSRISFLLRGGYREEGRSGAIRMRPGDLLLKSHRALHEDVFAAEGAVLLAVEFFDDDPFAAAGDPDCWRWRSDAFALRHAVAIVHAARTGDGRCVYAAAYDIIACTPEAPTDGRAPPRWLRDLHDELEQTGLAEVDVAARARAAGVHPAHASRLFRRCYGSSITEHAQTHCVRRAIGPLAENMAPLSEVAVAAGFYDQSHMNRVFRRMVGRTPGEYRGVLLGC
jgi:AraC family transcriptional regulator